MAGFWIMEFGEKASSPNTKSKGALLTSKPNPRFGGQGDQREQALRQVHGSLRGEFCQRAVGAGAAGGERWIRHECIRWLERQRGETRVGLIPWMDKILRHL